MRKKNKDFIFRFTNLSACPKCGAEYEEVAGEVTVGKNGKAYKGTCKHIPENIRIIIK